jgi:hypothetical protein
MSTEKVRENRARRVAHRRGYELKKSRRRDPRALEYNGYMLVDTLTNVVVYGATPIAFAATLEDIEEYLSEPDIADSRRREIRAGVTPKVDSRSRQGRTGKGVNDPSRRRSVRRKR